MELVEANMEFKKVALEVKMDRLGKRFGQKYTTNFRLREKRRLNISKYLIGLK